MSEEEKKAIETLEIEGTENNYLEVRILLNLVEKQQKEIEELKLITRQYNSYCINTDDETRIILAHKHYFDSGVFTSNFISKDKIRELLEEYKDTGYYEVEQVLKELLEEDGDHIPRID